jgi:hypothetical protein
MNPSDLWTFLPLGYALTVLIETPVLLVGLSRRHSLGRRLFAGLWLTACTYPMVVLVLPLVIDARANHALYLLTAETFAPVAECALFWAAFGGKASEQATCGRLAPRVASARAASGPYWRDWAAIVAANLASFLAGELMYVLWWR